MDKKDSRILFELTKNARISTKHLAKKIKLSESSTIHRINKLFSKGIILDSHAIIDYSKLGFQAYRVYLSFTNTTTKIEKLIIQWLVNEKSISIVGRSSGAADIIIQFGVKHSNEFEKTIRRFKEKYGEYIKDFQADVYVKTYFFNRNYLVDEKEKEYFSIGDCKEIKHDELDLNILKLLSENARYTKKDVAKKLKKSLRTVNHRIKQLEENKIIVGYTINLYSKMLGYEHYKLGIVFTKNIKHEDLLGFAANIDNTVYIDYSISNFDFELNLEYESYEKVEEIINKMKNELGGIKDLYIYKPNKFYKFRYY